MSIPMDTMCLECQLRRNAELARSLGDEATATAFLRKWMQIVTALPPEAPSPCSGPATNQLLHQMYGLDLDRYREEKRQSNEFALAHLQDVRSRIEKAEDRVFAGIQFAIAGNYLDFSALQGQVSFEKFTEMLDTADKMQFDMTVFQRFCRDLEKGKSLLYLTDNAGEIAFDRLLAEELQRKYPNLSITFCVRGGIAANDATREDAAAVGIPFPVIDNGNLVAGTVPEQLGQEARTAMEEADVIFAKGMGNAETLLGCGKNIYYAFLVKCARFVHIMRRPLMTPMLVRELDQR